MEREIETKCIHLEEDEASIQHFGSISYPIYQTATYAHPAVGQSTGFDYSRLQNPTREHLEKVVASLENGVDALAFSSGMAAITMLMELLRRGTISLLIPISTEAAFVFLIMYPPKMASAFPELTARKKMWKRLFRKIQRLFMWRPRRIR